jgi:hypothetical protein
MVVYLFCLSVVGVVCTVATADAQNLHAHSKQTGSPVKVATVAGTASRSGSLSGIKFSDPYAPPVGTGKAAIVRFPARPRDEPVQPQGGVSLTAGRDAPDEPMTGGVKLSF